MQRKKIETTVHTLLKMIRLPLKDPKTFSNFDFSVIKGWDANRLKMLPSLSAINAHRNLEFLGSAGTGKTHLAQAFGYECFQRGLRPVSLRCPSYGTNSPPTLTRTFSETSLYVFTKFAIFYRRYVSRFLLKYITEKKKQPENRLLIYIFA